MPTCEYCNKNFSERGIGTHRRWCKGKTGLAFGGFTETEEGNLKVSGRSPRARKAEMTRKTNETAIELALNIDGCGESNINTGIGFFDHVLESFATHGLFDLDIQAKGDVEVDGHHTIEDVGIVLGKAFNKALGDKGGIERFSQRSVPMDETVATVVLDISGRPYFKFNGDFSEESVGSFTSSMAPHFFQSLAMNAKITLNCSVTGLNAHHEIEALFKAVAKSIDDATRIDNRRIGSPSTKGEL
jgi:imidazoleglycerol-phosphate dehydratase